MNQSAIKTILPPPTLSVIPIRVDTAQVVEDEPILTALEERQNLLAHHVRLVARGMSLGLFVFGSPGVTARAERCYGRWLRKAFRRYSSTAM